MQYYEKMEVRDIHNDMPLAAACQMDVDKFCKDIKSGAPAGLAKCRTLSLSGVIHFRRVQLVDMG